MKLKTTLLAIPVLLGAAAAFAQTTTVDDGPKEGSVFGYNWPEGMGGSFFSDEQMKTLKSNDDIKSSWESLSEADRQILRDDCVRIKASADTSSTDPSVKAESSATADNATGADSTTSGTTSDTATMPAISNESITQLCTVLELQ